jgi:hypothetical protein
MTSSQKFILDLGYSGACSPQEAAAWHYRALRLKFSYERFEASQRPSHGWSDGGGDDTNSVEIEDHERAIGEIGLCDFELTENTLKIDLPEDLESIIHAWVL